MISYLFAKAAEGAGGGVFLVGTLEYEPLASEADNDIIRVDERTIRITNVRFGELLSCRIRDTRQRKKRMSENKGCPVTMSWTSVDGR